MRLRFATLAIALLASPVAVPAGEVQLSGPEITSALSGKTVEGEHEGSTWTQEFMVSGETIYVTNGRKDPGSWQVRGDQYCSLWPPSDSWDCYTITRDGDMINFVPAGGGETWPARLVK